jgi:small-conductance mechanosensitive channel
MSNFKYNDKVYSFVVNGQTGKISGKSPISPWRVAIAVLIAIVILGIVFYFEM